MNKIEQNAPIKEMDVCMLYAARFPQMFVRINRIWAADKPDWWNVNFTKIGMPLEHLTWTLDSNHLAGYEWEMGGIPMQFQVLPFPEIEGEETKLKMPTDEEVVTEVVERIFNKDRPKVVSLFAGKSNLPQFDPPSAA